MDKTIRDCVKFANMTSEMQENFKEIFWKESTSHAYKLNHTLIITCQDRSSVSAYYPSR
ncbi:hypothetical protein R6Q57_024988 [Mikania cordata]